MSGEARRVNANTVEFVLKVTGEEGESTRDVLSSDKKTLTITGRERTPQGPVEFIEVLERQ
jgi:hypothetical protein